MHVLPTDLPEACTQLVCNSLCDSPSPPHSHNQGHHMQEVYDVYAAHQPLEEGEEKHIISVFVADESGIINRVAGVFARRGTPQLKS